MSAIALARQSVSFNSGYTNPVLMQNSVADSLQNVNPSDEDPMSGASSVESLTSNASLPSCINGTLSGSYGYQDNSRASLPTATSSGNVNDITAGRISHWAVSFDRLLDDTLGVKYFREFLRKEFSEENILFWEACEELRRSDGDDEEKLKSNIISIYERFLAPEASMSVNIDSHGQQLAEEALQAPPHPGVFLTQQHQVYTLMRLDSYSRFLKSPLYRQCMVSEMEGRPLPLDSPEWSNPDPDSLKGGSRSIDSGSMHRKSKKAKGSKKGIFSFKNRPKSQREFKSHNSLSRRSSGNAESSGSESAYPVSRTASLPGNSMSFPDPTRVCHVTLWDSSSTVLYPKRGNATVAEALGNLCENRGVRLSALDVYFAEDYAAPSSEGKHKRPLSLDLDVSVLASQSIVLERRSLFRLDMLPVKRSVGVKARPTKTVAEVLRPVLNKYHLKLDHVLVRESVDQKEVVLHQPVSTLDGLKIIVEDKPGETKKDEGVTDKNKQRKKEQTLPRKNRSGNREVVSEKKETEAMLDLMTSLQSSKLNDQRGLISEADLELPDFLKLKPINDNSNNNVACDATKRALTPTSVEPVVEKIAPYAVSPVVNDVSSGHYRLSRLSASGRNEKDKKCYVELNAQHKAMTSFKPPIAPRPSDIETSDDTNDETIVEDPGVLDHQFDPNVTLQPLPTPPRHQWSSGDTRSPPLADYPPPTPLSAKNISHKE